MTSYCEAREEAERLKKVTGRAIEVESIDCDCDYHRNCGKCGASGTYYELLYSFCNHRVEDDDRDEQCAELGCRDRELGEVFPLESPALRSLSECASELEELEYAR
jgi:hypothetical protein